LQLEEAANNLRKKQSHNQDGDDAEIELPEVQVLLYSSRQFGPSSIRELTVSSFMPSKTYLKLCCTGMP
jgi:hypothetical protein